MENSGYDSDMLGRKASRREQNRIVHRHVHHHVHYHDGSDEENAAASPVSPMYVSQQGQRQAEMDTQARLRAQGGYPAGAGPPAMGSRAGSISEPNLYPGMPLDSQCETPKWRSQQQLRKPPPLGVLPPMVLVDEENMDTARTQEAFPQRPANLPNFSRGLAKASGAYSESGRPSHLRGRGH